MQTVTTQAILREAISQWRKQGDQIALVPTMGNLHEGHLNLIRCAQELADRVVVSIFVNPMQFDKKSDFDAYPSTIDEDSIILAEVNTDCLFLPTPEEVYPNGVDGATRVEIPGLSDILCGEHRPGHFVGVSTVVAKLFSMVAPNIAIFGEKDYQQCLLIRRMVTDLCMPVRIEAVATVREQNGLALSSRNKYLTVEQQDQASILYKTLRGAREQVLAGESGFTELEAKAMARLKQSGFRPEYFTVRQADSLDLPSMGNLPSSGDLPSPDLLSQGDQGLIILAAAWLGKARLIDNLRV